MCAQLKMIEQIELRFSAECGEFKSLLKNVYEIFIKF